MKVTMMLALGLALVAPSTAALAAKAKHTAPKTPTHHCMLNGQEVQKSKKACTKAGGTWEAGAPTTAKSSTKTTEPAAK